MQDSMQDADAFFLARMAGKKALPSKPAFKCAGCARTEHNPNGSEIVEGKRYCYSCLEGIFGED